MMKLAVHLKLLIFFWVETLSDLCEMIVYGSQKLTGVLNRHKGFQNIGLSNPVFTVENSADNNPIHTTYTQSIHTTCMVSNPLLQNICRLVVLLNCTM